MLAVNRFRVRPGDEDDFLARAGAAVDFMRTREGAESIDLVRNLDEPDLWAIVGRWANVGSYRRSFNGWPAFASLRTRSAQSRISIWPSACSTSAVQLSTQSPSL